MLKWFMSFNRTLVSKGMDIAQLVYGGICILIGLVLLNIAGYYKNDFIGCVSGMFGIAGMILIILSVWCLIKDDVVAFFKEVRNNIK
jgi:hypothetical protein